jgi:predicted patatin/cPLA2 family phospholipase
MPEHGTALVVEGGGLRGAFAVGVLRVFLEKLGSEYFDGVYAVSSGVFAATYFVANQGEEMESTWRDRVCDNQLVNYWNGFRRQPILRLDYLIDLFKGPVRLDVQAVLNAKATLEYVLTDWNSGQAVYVNAKSPHLFDYMRASSALPAVYRLPVVIDGHAYYDGGQSDAIPVQRPIEHGKRRIVVIRTRPPGYDKKPRSRWLARRLLPHSPAAQDAWASLNERYNSAVDLIAHPPIGVSIVSINPPQLMLGRLSRSRERIVAAIEQGKEVATVALQNQAQFFEPPEKPPVSRASA